MSLTAAFESSLREFVYMHESVTVRDAVRFIGGNEDFILELASSLGLAVNCPAGADFVHSPDRAEWRISKPWLG